MAKYIDADKLLAEAKELSGPITGDGWDNLGVYSMIERQPEADVRENVRGKWLTYYGDEIQLDSLGRTHAECYCSVCGDYLCASYEYACRGNFCPNCGAYMRGENNGKD